jgi:signal peptide peptidase SppA
MMHPDHVSGYLPVVARVLKGEDPNMTAPKLHLHLFQQSGGLKVKTILADTWYEDPNNLFEDVTEPTTLVIPVEGAITKYDNCGYYGAQTYAKVLAQAAAHEHIQGIVLKMDSPGGSADGSFDFAEAVAEAAKVKKVVAFADGLMASAAYRVAARASSIVAKPGSIIGSIGTMVSFRDYTEYFEEKGIKEHRIYASKSTDKNADYEEAIKGNYVPMREQVLDPLNELFLKEMRDARNLPEAALTGKVFDPVEAKKLGMIDSIGNMKDAMSLATGKQKTPTNNSSIKNETMKLGQSILAFLGLTTQPEQLSQEQLDQLEGLAGENARLSQELDAAKAAKATAEETLTTMTAERDEWQQKAETYGKQPGEKPTSVKKDEDAEIDLEVFENEDVKNIVKAGQNKKNQQPK